MLADLASMGRGTRMARVKGPRFKLKIWTEDGSVSEADSGVPRPEDAEQVALLCFAMNMLSFGIYPADPDSLPNVKEFREAMLSFIAASKKYLNSLT